MPLHDFFEQAYWAFSYSRVHSLLLDTLYFLFAFCIAFKMAWVIRQTSEVGGLTVRFMRFFGAAVAVVIMSKSILRFHGGDPASSLDVIREALWCGFMAYAIAWNKERLGKL